MNAETVSIILKMQADMRAAIEMSQQLRKLEADAQRTRASFANLARGAAGIFGVGLSAGGVASMVRGALEFASAVKNLAAESQTGTQAFQALARLAAENGVRQEQLSAALVSLRKNLQEAVANGAHPLNRELKALGLSAVGLQALAPERQFEILGSAIRGASDQAAAYNTAMRIFGTQNGPKLLSTMQALAKDGFGAVEEKTRNLRFTDEQLATIDDARVKLKEIAEWLTLIGAKGVVSVATAPSASAPNAAQAMARIGFGNSIDAAQTLSRLAAQADTGGLFERLNANNGRGMTPADVERVKLEAQMREAEAAAKRSREAEEALKLENEQIAQAAKNYSTLQRGILNANADNQERRRELAARRAADERLRAARAAIEAADELVNASRNELAVMQTNPFRTNREKAEQRVRILTLENKQLEAQIALNQRLAEKMPDQSATLLGQNRELGSRINANTLEIGENTPLTGAGSNLRAGIADVQNDLLSAGERVRATFGESIRSGIDAATQGIQTLIGSTDYWTQRLGAAGAVVGALTNGIAKMFVEWMAGRALAAAANMKWAFMEGAAEKLAKMPGAILASISSFGTAALVGTAAVVAALGAFGGFKTGGFTGHGRSSEIAGAVHRGEFVFPADVTAKLGPDTLQGLMTAARYDVGASSGGLATPAVRRPGRTLLVDHRDQDLVRRLENDPNYETSIVHIGERNRYRLGVPS